MRPTAQEFDSLVRALHADLYRYALWLCRDRRMAEELLQETFARALRAWSSLREIKAAKSWFISILRREYLRQFERRPPDRADVDVDDLMAEGGLDPAEILALRRALAMLPRDYLEPLLMQVLMGEDCAEIGVQLGISTGAVMTRLSRARQKLRKLLEAPRRVTRGE
ncbi:MAG TPA: sigma-70 family RNA polymerase sigma factor [Acidiferrobacterales bacterium]|jgi:RNA polymerase sigma-70 factor (ECF subfamily)